MAENRLALADLKAKSPKDLLAMAEELKGTVVYLASGATDYMTGNMLVIDGGILAR